MTRKQSAIPETLPPIEANHLMREIARLLMNGARYSVQQFPAHTGLVTQMRTAWEQKRPAQFQRVLTSYIIQAQHLLPQAGGEEQHALWKETVSHYLRHKDYGLDKVAGYFIRAANAPVDRF